MFSLKKFSFCPAKLWSNADFILQNYGAMQTLPRKIKDPLFCAPQNQGDFVLCPAELCSNADFALRNHGDIVLDANKYPKIRFSSLFPVYFCESKTFRNWRATFCQGYPVVTCQHHEVVLPNTL